MCLRILASQCAERGSGVRPEAVFSTAWEMLPCVRPKEYFRPGQVDTVGRFNNVAIGRDPRRPRLRLPGSGGIPDVTTVFTDIHLYVPRHSRAVFVERLDFASSLGHTPDRKHGRGPQYLVSELGELELLRTEVDPLDVRRLEFLSGSRRREALEAILRCERANTTSL